MRRRQLIIVAITFTALVMGIPIMGAGMWMASEAENACAYILQQPMMLMGGFVVVASLAGVVGALWHNYWLILFYQFVTLLLVIVLLLALVTFTFVVTSASSNWLRHRVQRPPKWARIRGCLASTAACARINRTYASYQTFLDARISPLQSGCCKPPSECGYSFVSPTNWLSPKNTSADADCLKWSNDQRMLCYDCNKCKEGLVADLKKEWGRANIVLVITLVALILVWLVGFCWLLLDCITVRTFGERLMY